MKDSPIKEAEHLEFFNDAMEALKKITLNTQLSSVADSMAVNRRLAEALAESRQIVEGEAVQVLDAMCLAFDGKSTKLKNLKAMTEQVSAESAFMKTALNSIETKTLEIDRLAVAINGLSESMERFKRLVDDGTLEKAAKAALSIS